MNNFSDLPFLEKMQELIRKLPKCFTNCELRTANLSPVHVATPVLASTMLDVPS